MEKINKIFFKVLVLLLALTPAETKSEILSQGNSDAKVVVKVFSSLTCPACANFHSKIYYELKTEFIDKGLVKFEHHPFPLDLAALNAEIILRCNVNNSKRFEFLNRIYENQKIWAVGSDINKINESIKKIGLEFNLNVGKMDNCLKDEKFQDEILNRRIEAQKKYKIEATPTILINEKKYTGNVEYKKFKKIIKKNL